MRGIALLLCYIYLSLGTPILTQEPGVSVQTPCRNETAVETLCRVQDTLSDIQTALQQRRYHDDPATDTPTRITELNTTITAYHTLDNQLQLLKAKQAITDSDVQVTDAKLKSAELKLRATQSELVSDIKTTKSDLEVTKSEFQTTKSDLEATKSALEEMKLGLFSGLQAARSELEASKTELQAVKQDLQATKTNFLDTVSALSQGSTYIRWGRKSCPENTTLIYAGQAGGKNWDYKGGGTNSLCLTLSPQLGRSFQSSAISYLYGGEYHMWLPHSQHDVPCSVCLTPLSSTIMIPATRTCPPEWTAQYRGHLTAQQNSDFASEFTCMDGSPEHVPGGQKNTDGHVFYPVLTACGTLPCPPYSDGKVVTCVVCSK